MKIKLTIALAAMTIGFQLQLLPKASPSVWDGVYSADQAKTGEALYAKQCAGCHGETLDGVGATPALAGDDFKMNWNGHNADDLFEKIQTTMPAGGAGKLKRTETAAIVAFIFKTNGYPAGSKELPAEGEPLESIRIEAAKSK